MVARPASIRRTSPRGTAGSRSTPLAGQPAASRGVTWRSMSAARISAGQSPHQGTGSRSGAYSPPREWPISRQGAGYAGRPEQLPELIGDLGGSAQQLRPVAPPGPGPVVDDARGELRRPALDVPVVQAGRAAILTTTDLCARPARRPENHRLPACWPAGRGGRAGSSGLHCSPSSARTSTGRTRTPPRTWWATGRSRCGSAGTPGRAPDLAYRPAARCTRRYGPACARRCGRLV
jgi:hypothetical protein